MKMSETKHLNVFDYSSTLDSAFLFNCRLTASQIQSPAQVQLTFFISKRLLKVCSSFTKEPWLENVILGLLKSFQSVKITYRISV